MLLLFLHCFCRFGWLIYWIWYDYNLTRQLTSFTLSTFSCTHSHIHWRTALFLPNRLTAVDSETERVGERKKDIRFRYMYMQTSDWYSTGFDITCIFGLIKNMFAKFVASYYDQFHIQPQYTHRLLFLMSDILVREVTFNISNIYFYSFDPLWNKNQRKKRLLHFSCIFYFEKQQQSQITGTPRQLLLLQPQQQKQPINKQAVQIKAQTSKLCSFFAVF